MKKTIMRIQWVRYNVQFTKIATYTYVAGKLKLPDLVALAIFFLASTKVIPDSTNSAMFRFTDFGCEAII